ncbi:putative kinase [Mizugakiibacter sediminis]|uniref:Putative kinase n=1 Tax=Mizugakiibacter sediminis TaxID=1475481 RepID=A0A0K8QJX9_9GAMM|nr:kinase [Mizugakiibacter sediminis]GAP65143.1 putative kinase [Mizugakiibacter sediminis]
MIGGDASTGPAALAAPLLRYYAARIARARRPFVLGISGLQGSGKSTLARALLREARRRGLSAVALSLDDVYHGRRARAALARRVHPLFATRGVPGTHDLALLTRTLEALARASPRRPARLPRFDKGRDTRKPPSHWPRVARAPDLIVLEGWCLGLRPQRAQALSVPVNALERREDADGRWRRAVDRALRAYQPLWRRLHALVLLAAPSFAVVRRWRGEQERALRRRGAPRAMDAAALDRFIAHYERLGRHALATLPPRADVRIELDAARRVLRAFGTSCRPRGMDRSIPGIKPARPPPPCRRPAPR